MLSILAAWALAGLRPFKRIRPAQLAVTAVVALALLWVVADGLDRRVRGVQDHGVAINLPVADGARDRAARVPPLERAVHSWTRSCLAGSRSTSPPCARTS